jgi:tRNA 2-thiouridine synthesizing protein A
MTETHLDLRGLKCPLPAMRTRKALAGIEAGTLLIVACTDPLAAIDLANLTRETGDVLESRTDVASFAEFRIRKRDL